MDKKDIYFYIALILLIIILIGLIIWYIIKKISKNKPCNKYAGLTNNNNSCFFNVCMQIVASLDYLYDYLQKSNLKEDSFTTNLLNFIKDIRKNNTVIDNTDGYQNIMKYFCISKQFKYSKENSADEFFNYLLNLLYYEEISGLKLKILSNELTKSEYKNLKENSFIFNYFALVNFNQNYNFTFSIYTQAVNDIQYTINNFLYGNNEYTIPNWDSINISHFPKYLFIAFTSDCFKTNNFDFEQNLCLNFKDCVYKLKSFVLYYKPIIGVNHYFVVTKRDDQFISFNDSLVEYFDIKKKFTGNYDITFTIYELIDTN
ncbi:hypothetical protein TUBRATIS_29710 [Tubulinosema ratisbonensis]|uniref:USP domain-containing protein n=1 Tax=Tubulinosema ratisbonensis TaxID=291195 RepID=A0A437AHI9_9MICR|nr:hypothetical protein TUBRATIS_29710 [Tubulinosema ratisbonensis]